MNIIGKKFTLKMTSQPPAVKFKVVILGTQGVGKTCLFNRIVNDKFSDKYEAVSFIMLKVMFLLWLVGYGIRGPWL